MPVSREETGTGANLTTGQGDRVVGGRIQSDGGQWVVLVDENGFATLMSEGDLYDAEDVSVREAEEESSSTSPTGTTGTGSTGRSSAKSSKD